MYALHGLGEVSKRAVLMQCTAMFDAQFFAELPDPIRDLVSLLCSHNCNIVGALMRMDIMLLHRALEELVVGQGL